ncbi:MAG TPA: HAD family phosphatase [Vicinamibacterales bacterium]|nr:HAD family phosphatase [Vicinamibacterales bacterium]
MQREIRAVVFDMDGLMLDTEPIYKRAWQSAATGLGCDLDDGFYAQFVGRPNDDCERLLIERFGAALPLDRFRARWRELWNADAAANGIQTKPGLLELLVVLDTLSLPFAIATSSEAEETAFCLRAAGLDGRFPVRVTRDQIAHGKPAPDIYLEAARRLQTDPAHCVALEDSEAGIVSARRAGMVPLLIPDGVPPSARASNIAFRILPSLAHVPDVLTELLGA